MLVLEKAPDRPVNSHQTQMFDYGKGESFHDDWHPFLGDSIFTTDDEAWRYSRQLIRPQFVKDRISDLDILEKHVGRLMSHIDGHGEEVDIADFFYRMTLDSTTDYLLGESVDSLDDPRTEFASAFVEVQRGEWIILGCRFPTCKSVDSDLRYISGTIENLA